MKTKLLISIACLLFLALNANSQSQRLVLAEDFCNASCPPCATANVALNAIINANTTKVTKLTYAVYWPGIDPMNAQNHSEAQTRIGYYSVAAVPEVLLDAADYYYTPITQTEIDNEYAVPSPFTITLSHSFNASYDSIFISETITCTQAVTGNLVNQIALIEDHIHYAVAPGTNGETDFYDIMRKMYPDANGTALSNSWTVGQTQTITIAAPLPSYIYDINQVAIVAFIQDNTTKNVHQAAYSAPLALPVASVDAGVTAITNINPIQCVNAVSPIVTIKNFSASTLSSCLVNYQIDSGAIFTQLWTGSLAPGASGNLTLPTMAFAAGLSILHCYTSMPDWLPDYYSFNNSCTKKINIIGTPAPSPLAEGFLATTFPPANWVVDDLDGAYQWQRTAPGGFGTSPSSSGVNFYNDAAGNIEDMYIKPLDMTSPLPYAILSFDVAYSQYSTENDKLEIHVSADCGLTWTQVFSKQGSTLSTTGIGITTQFYPTSTQWRKEMVNLTAYVNQPNVVIRYRATSAYGNNLFVDNINIFNSSSALTIDEPNASASVNIYPNPATTQFTIDITNAHTQQLTVEVFDILGNRVMSRKHQLQVGENVLNTSIEEYASGIYLVRIMDENNTLLRTQKIVKE